MLRWVFLAGLFQVACLQTEPIELSPDASDGDANDGARQEVAEPAETTVEVAPETVGVEPCIAVTPSRIAFGAHPIGESAVVLVDLTSCGDGPLVVSEIALTNDGGGQYSIDVAEVPATLIPGETMSVRVVFTPTTLANIDGAGNGIPTEGELTIVSDAPSGRLSIPIEGYGGELGCPIAVIRVAEGDEVLPQTLLHLDGSASTAPGGTIEGYEWTVVQPNGSVSVFMPSASQVAPTFEANVIGFYTFRLNVIDSFGNRSCAPAEYEVLALQAQPIHVEVIWDTPGDANQNDTGSAGIGPGSDVDLHFLSPKANGELFGTYDCHWDNAQPDWGAPGPDNDPRLDRDDSDGSGPENLSVDAPEQGARYQVTAHYFDDWGYGDSVVTVRIYIYGELRDQWSTTLTMNDQWDTHYIDWPSGTVTRIGDGAPQIKQTIYDINR